MSNSTVNLGVNSPENEAFGSSGYADQVGARMLDFFQETSPWQRRLWDVGTCLVLDEVIEAVAWRGRRVLSDGAVTWLAKDAERIAGRDPALGEAAMRKHLTDTLRSSLDDGSRHTRRLRELSEMAAEGYLDRWLALLRSGKRPSIERFARAVSAHLLDQGYSLPFLRKWAQTHVRNESTLGELLEAASGLASRAEQDYNVIVPFRAVPRAKTSLTTKEPTWRDAPTVSQWLRNNGGSAAGVRQVGGFEYQIRAHDPLGAALQATDRVDRLLSRATLARGRGEAPEPEGSIWVSGTTRPFKLDRASRGAFVLSLVAESRLYDVNVRTDLDDALELASVLNLGSPGPAIASGWAAVEALLVSAQDPEDSKAGRGAVAADRLASLVACSWPRADLTALSYQHSPSLPDATSTRLDAASSNQQRAAIIATALANGQRLTLQRGSDRAAESRMVRLMDAQRPTLKDVEAHVRSAMRRLYRQRNIVMHGGSTDTLARDAALRTCAPLVGAGLDRIAHSRISRSESALQLAERAQLSLDLVGTAGGPSVTALLD
ncbi:MAG: integrase [Actinobacteria bacterium]|nr:integrase [Actinomycetota bacterium]